MDYPLRFSLPASNFWCTVWGCWDISATHTPTGNSHPVQILPWLDSPLTPQVWSQDLLHGAFQVSLTCLSQPAPGWSPLYSATAPSSRAAQAPHAAWTCPADASRWTRVCLCGQEAPATGGLIDIFKSLDRAKVQTRLQTIQLGHEPWDVRL